MTKGRKKKNTGMIIVLIFAMLCTVIGSSFPAVSKVVRAQGTNVSLTISAVETTRTIDQETVPVLRWSGQISHLSDQEELIYVNTLLPEDDSCPVEYVTNYPLLLTFYKNGSAVSQSYYYWTSDDVTLSENKRSFTLILSKDGEYDGYSVDYYTTFQTEPGGDNTFSVHGAVKQKDEEENLAEADGSYKKEVLPPKISVSISGDDGGISYAARVTVPSGNKGMQFHTGGGVTVEKDGKEVVMNFSIKDVLSSGVTVKTASGAVTEFQKYKEGGSTENTYLFVSDPDAANVYSVDMYFNTESQEVEDSYWNLDEEAVLEVNLTISTSVADEDGRTIADYMAEGYNIKNYFFGDFQGYGVSEGTASYCNVVRKSSDLNDFITNINIYDEENTLQYGTNTAGETVKNVMYVNRDYIYELSFEERNNPGEYVEMKPDASGYMTYHIPIQIHPLTDDLEPQEITLSNGKAVAEFYIQNQTIKLKFYDVDEYGNDTPGTSWIDSPGLKKLKLRFEGAFSTKTSDTIDLNLGEDYIIKVDLVDDSALQIKKQAGDYDPTSHTIAYTVTASGKGNGVKGLTLTDTITTKNGTLVADSLTAKVGDEEQKKLVCKENEDGSYVITGLSDLKEGEVLTLSYQVHINDEVAFLQPKGSIYLENTVDGTGKSPQGKVLNDSATAKKTVSVTNMAKTGYSTKKNNTPVIQWTATIGDGSSDVGGLVMEDTLGSYLTLYKDQAIEVEAVKQDGTVSKQNFTWTNDKVQPGENEKSFQFTLPASEKDNPYTLFRVRYYTTYETTGAFTTFYNTIHVTLYEKPMGVTGSCSIAPPGNITITKTGERKDGYLEWTIQMEVPAGLYGTRGFYITDYCDGVILLENGQLAYKAADLTGSLWDVSVETESGEVIKFSRYKGKGITENTYSIAWENQFTNGKYNNTRAILFNCTGLNTWDSTWMINEKSTITIRQRVPITNGVGDGYTAEEVLDGGGYMSNIATGFVAEASKGRSTAIINGEPLHKTGQQRKGDDVFEYEVVLRNNDHVNNRAIVTAADTVNLEFLDDFDERMEYVQGSLKLELKTYETTSSPGQLVDTFYYKGGATGSGSLCATADAFVNSQGKTLKEYAAARGGTSWYNFFFTYQLRVKDIYKYIVATKLQLDNKATLRWGTDETQTLSADETVTYKTDLLTKRILDAPEEGETLGNGNILKYQIELNPREADLDPNSDVLTVLDTLPDCLNVIWDNENQNNVIGEYWDEEAGWVSFEDAKDKTWQKGYYYDKSLGKNVLRFQIPDNCHVRITYGCQVTEYGTSVEIANQVSILGQTTLEDSVSSVFHVNVKTGSAESDEQQFAIIKTDSTSHEPLEYVKFVLYSQESRTNRVPEEEGIPAEISGKDGRAYYYFGTYETDSNGYCLVQGLNNGGKYILREYEAPAGYTKMEDKYIQYTENPLEDSKLTENFDNVFKNQTLSIVNEAFLLPETGGAGRIALYGLAVLLVLAGAGYLLRKKKI